jgi:hypothetical protein
MANYIIIGGDGKEYGPVTDTDVRQWIAEGRLAAASLAKGEGDAEFRPLSKFPELAANFAPQNLSMASASPPIAPPPAATFKPEESNWQAEVLAREPELKLGECLAAGWSFLAAHSGFLAGAVFLAWITNLFFQGVALVLPLLGPLAALAFNGVIMGGFYFACLRRLRGEPVAATEVFCGFKNSFGQLLLTGLVAGLLTGLSACCFILPMIYLFVAWIFALPLVAEKKLFFWAGMELSRKVVTRVWFEVFALVLLAFLPMILFQIFNFYQSAQMGLSLYNEAGQDWKQLGKLFESHAEEMKLFSYKSMALGQGVMLLNLFYLAGVMMRAYENLFGPRKP